MNIKWTFRTIALLSVLILKAQNIAVSPYSSYGVGEILYDNSIEHGGMAGLSTAISNPYGASANFSNPAANRSLNITSFEFATRTDMYKFKSDYGSDKGSSTYISNISLAFPAGTKTRVGIGFQPYSGAGYSIQNRTEEINNFYDGKGGLNSVHIMGSYNISPSLSVGARANYLFGNLDREQKVVVTGADLLTEYNYENQLKGAQFTLGGHYNKTIDTNKKLVLGATYTFGTKLNSKINDLTTTYTFNGDTPINIDTISFINSKTKTKLPQSFSLGASYGKDLNWMVGAQFDWTNWSEFDLYENRENTKFTNLYRMSLGGYWIPQFNSYKSYFERVTYRGGLFFEKTPLDINDSGINKYGLTIGAGLPIGKGNDASMFNFSFELGQRGTRTSGLIKETYGNLKVGFTINDVWFRKRVID